MPDKGDGCAGVDSDLDICKYPSLAVLCFDLWILLTEGIGNGCHVHASASILATRLREMGAGMVCHIGLNSFFPG
jgi:hypothetical protein